MLQGCRLPRPPSIGISPGPALVCVPDGIRGIPDAVGDAGVASG
jgi:hypothetical protein